MDPHSTNPSEAQIDAWVEKTRKELVDYTPPPPSEEVMDMRRSYCHWPRKK